MDALINPSTFAEMIAKEENGQVVSLSDKTTH